MVTDGDMLTKEISIHEDFEMKSLNDQFAMIQINCQKDFVDYYKNNIQKFKVIKLNTNHRILKMSFEFCNNNTLIIIPAKVDPKE